MLSSCGFIAKYYDKPPENQIFFSITFHSSNLSGRWFYSTRIMWFLIRSDLETLKIFETLRFIFQLLFRNWWILIFQVWKLPKKTLIDNIRFVNFLITKFFRIFKFFIDRNNSEITFRTVRFDLILNFLYKN